ncbi:DUF4129 domain-containing protein [Staphylospora marina]|uniref:DUF4129 domain-containing protein n=1 Tax=Staphylospora marina TaxID=2490858 RepID=UPI000F5BDF1B|nr:DUF4129 domain-containing protein [Staphylospora marina]
MINIKADMQKAREQLEEILSGSEFKRSEFGQNFEGLDDFPVSGEAPVGDSSFSEWFSAPLIPHLSGVEWMIWGTLGVSLAVILVWWLWNYRKNRPVSRKKPNESRTADWQEAAEHMVSKGAFRLALRALFVGLLEFAFREGKLKRHPAKTNGEYREEAKRNWPESAEDFRELSRTFDEVWYGNRAIGREELERYRLLTRKLTGRGESG